MKEKDEIIQGLQEIVDQKTQDGIVDGVNQQLIFCALSLLKKQQKLIDDIMQRRANNGAFD